MIDNPLEDLLACLEANGDLPGDIDQARAIGTQYVRDHPDEFADFAAWGTGQEALAQTVQACEVFRTAGMRAQWARAEAWHFATWEPQNIGGTAHPVLRNLNS